MRCCSRGGTNPTGQIKSAEYNNTICLSPVFTVTTRSHVELLETWKPPDQ